MTTTASLATKAMMSAQETTPGHSASTMLFTLSRKSNPRRDWFGNAAFSALFFVVEFISTEASQPWQNEQYITLNLDSWYISHSKTWLLSLIHMITNYPDKAVVEVHPEKSSCKRRCICYVLLDIILYDLLSIWATVVVETQLKIWLDTAQWAHYNTYDHKTLSSHVPHFAFHDLSMVLIILQPSCLEEPNAYAYL